MILKRLLICSGEPAGVGIELCLRLARWQNDFANVALIIVADERILKQRARQIDQSIDTISVDKSILRDNHRLAGFHQQAQNNATLLIYPVTHTHPTAYHQLSINHVPYVLEILTTAHRLCQHQDAEGILTLPIHKGIINTYLQHIQSPDRFLGHTEFFQHANHCDEVVMMLSCDKITVALATTHIPIHQVASSIHAEELEKKLILVHQHISKQLKRQAKIAVLGLNPHAGEGGYIGTQDKLIIQPVINKLRAEGMDLSGALSADSAFIESNLSRFDCFFGMYHDQVLPIVKHLGFHATTNITLGLPYMRVSVDHGTAIELVGTGRVSDGSLRYSVKKLTQLIEA